MKAKSLARHPHSSVPDQLPRSRRLIAMAACTLLLTACASVGPDYHEPPPVDIGSGWTLSAANAGAPELSRWWSALNDPVLDRLITTALAQNLDLRQAAARVDEA
ncbi:MAG TPA: TolC family protein, partial [Castellaniella sp.]|nr:TolC family protein [Castellaniella sp.]